MPAARNQAVAVRRPLANKRPASRTGRRTAVRRSSQWAKSAKRCDSEAGTCDNDMAGSSGARDKVTAVIVHRGPAAGQLPDGPARSRSRHHNSDQLLGFTEGCGKYRPLELMEILRIGLQIAEGLAGAH